MERTGEGGLVEYVRVCRIHHHELLVMERRRNDVLVCPVGSHPATRLVQDRISRPPVVKSSYEVWIRVNGCLVTLYARVEGGHVDLADKHEEPSPKLNGRKEDGMSTTPERPDRRRRYGLLAAAVGILGAASVSSALAGTPGGLNGGPGVVRAEGGAQAVMAGRSEDVAIRPTMHVEGDVPIGWGDDKDGTRRQPFMRGNVTVLLSGKPGAQSLNFNSTDALRTFQAAEVSLGGTRVFGVSGGYALAATCEWAFGARLNDDGGAPQERLTQRYGCGGRVYHRATGAGVKILYGRDQAVGATMNTGQIMASVGIMVPGTDQVVMLRVQSSIDLRVGAVVPYASRMGARQDYHSVGLTIDGAKLVGKLTNRKAKVARGGGTWASR